jgi:hypothetical protein
MQWRKQRLAKMLAGVRQRLVSRAWWLFLSMSETGTRCIRQMQAQFYQGEAAEDFELLLLPTPLEMPALLTLFLAKKSRMRAADVARVLTTTGTRRVTEEDLAGRHLLILGRPPQPEQAEPLWDWLDEQLAS